MNWRCDHSLDTIGLVGGKTSLRRRAHLSLHLSSFVDIRRIFALSLGRLSCARRFERTTECTLSSASNSFLTALNSTHMNYCHKILLALIIVTKFEYLSKKIYYYDPSHGD